MVHGLDVDSPPVRENKVGLTCFHAEVGAEVEGFCHGQLAGGPDKLPIGFLPFILSLGLIDPPKFSTSPSPIDGHVLGCIPKTFI